MLALSLAFAACLGWGIGDFLGGLKSRVVPVLTVLALSCLSGLALTAVLVVLRGTPPPADPALFFAVAAGAVGALGLLCLFRGMAVGSMAMVAAVSATGVALPVLVGLYGGDDPSGLQMIGMAAAVVGAVMAVRDKGANPAGANVAAGAGLALGAAVAFGSFFILIDLAGRSDPLWAALLVRLSEALCLLPAVLVTKPALRAARSHLPAILGVGIFDALGVYAFTLATTQGMLSVVSVVGSLYPAVTVSLAAIILREWPRRVQLAGISLAICGVALISGG
jgi:drug/metabolite transporter (DMT)-like permease